MSYQLAICYNQSMRTKRYALFLYRIGFAVLVAVSIVTQFISSSGKTGFNPINFFSFFTIESNILAAIVLLVGSSFALRKHSNTLWDLVRGAATVYMAMTGIIYALFLSGLEVSLQTTIPWVNTVLHYLMPFVMVVDWLINPPRSRISLKRALLWAIYPVAYVAYSLIRGHFVGWYPYPFLNVADHGYASVFVTSIVIAMGVFALIVLLSRPNRQKQ